MNITDRTTVRSILHAETRVVHCFVLFCLCRPWILHPVWIIHPVLGFIGFSLKPKVLGVCNAPSTNGSYGYIGIGGGNLLTLPTPVVKPNTTPAVI